MILFKLIGAVISLGAFLLTIGFFAGMVAVPILLGIGQIGH